VDGCGKWTLMLKNSDPEGFYDAFTFWDRKHGFLLGDPVMNTPFWQETDENQHVLVEPRLVDRKLKHKRFLTITTSDGGANWGYWGIDRGYFTEGAAKRGAAFAASNSALFVPPQVDDPCNVQPFESNRLWIAIGGKGGARVDMGVQDPGDVCPQDAESRAALRFGWSLPRSVPIAGGTESTGIFSIAFRLNDARLSQEVRSRIGIGVAVGGDYTKPNLSRGTAAWSRDGGWAWTASSKPPHGYRSTVQWSESLKAWITAGTNGSDISRDDGRTWEALDDGNWNALSLPFVVGPNGRIGRLNAGALGKR